MALTAALPPVTDALAAPSSAVVVKLVADRLTVSVILTGLLPFCVPTKKLLAVVSKPNTRFMSVVAVPVSFGGVAAVMPRLIPAVSSVMFSDWFSATLL